jgi:undecaprenyl-diphosphatase
LLILLARAPHQYDAIGAALLAVFSGILLFRLIKKSVGRKRPCTLEPHCWASHLLPPDQFSFPSGHSITAFAVAIPLGHFYPVAMPALLFCAGSVAASRVLLGMHFLSDVVVGSLLGAVLGYAAVALVI